MERRGITSHIPNKNLDTCDDLGENTPFRIICEGLVENTVKSGHWFTFCKQADEAQVDIMTLCNNKGIRLGSMLLDTFESSPYRTCIYKYLLHEYLCYFESPIVKREANLNGFKNSYNKYLITSNIRVVARWLGISDEEAESQYGSRLYGSDDDTGESDYPYLKLYVSKTHERKVTRPRANLNLEDSGIRIIPMFALKHGIDVLFKLASEAVYDVDFLKDSGQKRSISITFNKDLAIEAYGTELEFVNNNWSGVYDGDFLANPSLERGYIRVFELGSSIYNYPLRSINFARITGFEVAEPDMSYMYIDLETVLESFVSYIYKHDWAEGKIEEFVDALDDFEVGTNRNIGKARISTVSQIENWSNSQFILLSTVFQRQLALFMIGNPQWFPGYTGQPKVSNSYLSASAGNASISEGESPVDIGEDFELPFM